MRWRHLLLLAVLAVVLGVGGASAASGELLPNGSFEGGLSGWSGWNSTLSTASDGTVGPGAAKVISKGTSYSIFTNPRPVSSSIAGTVYTAQGWERSASLGQTICLRIREWVGGTAVGQASSCLAATSTWKAFPAATYTAHGGGSVEVYVYGSGASSGSSFEVDGLSLVSGSSQPPADTTPPETTITSAPSGTVASSSASFSFTSSESGSTFKCSLDSAPFTACSSPQSYSGLADGQHTFSVAATDAAGNADPTPATASWTVQTATPPPPPPSGTNLLPNGDFESGLTGWSGWNATLSLASDGPVGANAAKVTGTSTSFSINATPRPVNSPPKGTTYHAGGWVRGLSGKTYCVYIRERSSSNAILGATGSCVTATGAWQSFAGASYTSTGGANLELYVYTSGGASGQSFETDGLTLTDGSTSTPPPDTTPPDTTITSGPSGTVTSTDASFSFSSSESGSTFRCSLDSSAFTACTSPQSYSGLAAGTHTLQVAAVDAAGNVDPSPASATWTIQAPPPPPQDGVTLVAVGDQHACQAMTMTQQVANLAASYNAPVATLGDSSGEQGTAAEYSSCFDPTWGSMKARIHPTLGNHDWTTGNADGYFGYFGAAAGPVNQGWYSYDLGSWHVVVLSSYCGPVGGCGLGSPQVAWLKADLAAHPTQCTVAYFHHPLFTSTQEPGYSGTPYPLWQTLYANGVDLILSAHSHNYERFAPQDPDGNLDTAKGIREIVVGTGGADLHTNVTPAKNSEVFNDVTHGVLVLTLKAGSYDWKFVPVDGTFTDSGSAACH